MSSNNFELMPLKNGKTAIVLSGKRMLVGSSRACDIYIDYPGVSGIHAVIEINEDSFQIYDMNSLSGTFVGINRIVSSEFQLGDVLKFGIYEFKFKNYVNDDIVPPVLDMLSALPPTMPDSTMNQSKEKVSLPDAPIVNKPKTGVLAPRVAYPLESDPKAEFSEYIFEEADQLYPIFDYSINKTSTEVIIMFKDKVLSIDYLPQKKGIYSLVGVGGKINEVEYPYLGVKEKVVFIEQNVNETLVHSLHGYDAISICDVKKGNEKLETTTSLLNKDEIYRFIKGDIQIFVRGTDTPPVVARAPLFGRDKELRKYLLIMFLLVGFFLGGISLFEVDKELEKEKAPERIATILYKKKLVVAKSKAIDITKKAPKKIAQKSPTQKRLEKKKKKITKKVNNKKSNKPKNVKTSGVKSAKRHRKVKKVSANKSYKDNLKTNKVTKVKKRAGGRNSSKKAVNRKRFKNSRSRGAVEAYKSKDFASSLNSLMAKGGGTKSVKASTNDSSTVGDQSLSFSEDGATLKSAKVSNNIGSLSGATDGKLDSTRGAKGIVGKTNIYTAGLPYKTVIRGGMDPDVIRRILADHLPQFRYCYQRALDKASSAFNGVVKLSFIIGASGHVTRAGVNSATGSLPTKVKSCVIGVLKGIEFPKPRGGGIVEVNQPFNFYPVRK